MFPSLCSAEWKVSEYLEKKETLAVYFESYISGLGVGFSWYNVDMIMNGKPLYCPPAKLAVTTENYIRILDDEIKRNKKIYIEPILLDGLIRTFPCK